MTSLLAAVLALAPAYLIRFHIAGFPTTLLEVLIVAFLLSVTIRFEVKDFKKIKALGPINWAIGLFVLAAVISVLVSPEKIKALGQLKAFIIEPILVFYAIIVLIKNKNQLLPVVRTLFWAAVVISGLGVFQYYSFIHLPIRFWGNGVEVTRIVSVFEYPNALSLYLGPLLGFFAALWLKDYPLTKTKWTSALGLLLMAAALMLTFSRGAWFATAIGLLFILIQRFKFRKVILPLLLTGLVLIVLPGVRHRLAVSVWDASTAAHLNLLRVGANKILHSPLFGNGLYGFRTTQMQANYSGEILNYPHNIFLNFWLELGILGLISFAWIIFLAYK
ncbi:MAG TPA: O-antigen ligase family protein, partial [Patescibacteria group bacterium]